jgi:transketolase
MINKKQMRDGFGEVLVELGESNERILVLSADLKGSLRVAEFADRFPKRFFELGIAEQNMMGVAAGLAREGFIPVVTSFACFNPGRNWEQFKLAVCMTNENVKVVGGHAGVGNGGDGGSQQMYEDLAITTVLPNTTVLAPADYDQAKKATRAMIDHEGPVYMRMTKPAREVLSIDEPFHLGKLQVLREGRDVTVVGCGVGVEIGMKVAEKLKFEIDVEVVNMHTIKPLDEVGLLKSIRKTGRVVVIEEHQMIGGLGSMVARVMAREGLGMLEQVGVDNRFGESGDTGELLKSLGVSEEVTIGKIRSMMKK